MDDEDDDVSLDGGGGDDAATVATVVTDAGLLSTYATFDPNAAASFVTAASSESMHAPPSPGQGQVALPGMQQQSPSSLSVRTKSRQVAQDVAGEQDNCLTLNVCLPVF